MERITSISLGDHFEGFVDDKVASGKYNKASEVICTGLRLLGEDENKLVALKKTIEEGIDSRLVKKL